MTNKQSDVEGTAGDMPNELWAKRYGGSGGGTYWNKDTSGKGIKYVRADLTISPEDLANVRKALIRARSEDMSDILYSIDEALALLPKGVDL